MECYKNEQGIIIVKTYTKISFAESFRKISSVHFRTPFISIDVFVKFEGTKIDITPVIIVLYF